MRNAGAVAAASAAALLIGWCGGMVRGLRLAARPMGEGEPDAAEVQHEVQPEADNRMGFAPGEPAPGAESGERIARLEEAPPQEMDEGTSGGPGDAGDGLAGALGLPLTYGPPSAPLMKRDGTRALTAHEVLSTKDEGAGDFVPEWRLPAALEEF